MERSEYLAWLHLGAIRYRAMMPNLRAVKSERLLWISRFDSECLARMFESLAEMAGGGGSDGALSPDKPATATTPKPMPANTLKPARPIGLPTLPGW